MQRKLTLCAAKVWATPCKCSSRHELHVQPSVLLSATSSSAAGKAQAIEFTCCLCHSMLACMIASPQDPGSWDHVMACWGSFQVN